MKFQDYLKSLNACNNAVAWTNGKGLKKSWATCKRADWMLWGLAKMIDKPGWPTHQEIVLLACWCARKAQKYWKYKTDERPINAIKAAEKWAKNPINKNKEIVYTAAYAAAYAAANAAAYAAAYAAYAAADAADAATNAAYAAHAAANAANAAANAANAAAYATANAAAYAAAYAAEHKIMCDYIRSQVTIGKI